MKRKYADYPNWDKVEEKKYINKYFDNEDFKGNISLLKAVKVKEMLLDRENKNVIFDDGFQWIEFYPEENKNIALSSCINDKYEILDWYFDIAKDTSLTERGIPYIDDLFLDVILKPTGEIKLVDEDELQEAFDKKEITEEEFELAYKVANNLIKQINGKTEEIIKFTTKYFNLLKEVENDNNT